MELNAQRFDEILKPCQSCGKPTKGRYKYSDNDNACCEKCWAKLPVMD
jgi:hypothetical protein